MVMAPAGWAIERAMAAVPLSRIAERRAIAPERLADDVGGSQPPALLPPRTGSTRITVAIIRRFIVHLPVNAQREWRKPPAAEAAAEEEEEAEEEVVAAGVAPSAASCWRHSVRNC